MTRRAVLAWALAVLTWAGAVAQVAITVAADGVALFSVETVGEGLPILTFAVVIGATVGALIVSRHPRNRIGWLLCIGQPGTIFGLVFADYGRYVYDGQLSGSRETGQLFIWLGHLFGGALAVGLVTILLLLVPEGHVASRRWRFAIPSAVLGIVITAAAVLITPMSVVTTDEEAAVPTRTIVTSAVGVAFLFVGMVAAAISLPLRLRRARGEQRQQLRWIALSAALLVLGVLVQVAVSASGVDPDEAWYVDVPLFVGYLSVPLATGVAVLRYRLYDVDVILGRALVLAVLLAFVTVGYVAVVVAIGAFLGRQAGSDFWPSLLATALVAVGFQPMRRRVSRWADRVAYGERAVPYEALADFTRELECSLSTAELLPRVAEAAARTVNASATVVTLDVPGGQDVRVTWPPGHDAHAGHPDAVRCVTHAGVELGTIAVSAPSGRPLRRAELRLLDDLAVQAAVPFHNARLSAALEQRSRELAADAAEVEASRRRLIVAGDAERRRIARAINRQVLPHLDHVPVQLDQIDRFGEAVTSALDELRAISRGVFPPLLGRKGLAAALRTYVGPGAGVLDVGPDLDGRRFAAPVEAAAYFCCVEMVRHLGSPARVTVTLAAGSLQVSVSGTRRAAAGELEPDLQLIEDRVAAVGGRVDVRVAGPVVDVLAAIPVEDRLGMKPEVAEAPAGHDSVLSGGRLDSLSDQGR